MPRWQGKSKGTPLGYRIFIYICRNLGVYPAYGLLIFVAFYFFLFSTASSKAIFRYFRDHQGRSVIRSIVGIYKNYFLLGQTLLDKIMVMANVANKFTYHFDGLDNLQQIVSMGRGGILLSAHVGSWEMASHHLKHLNTKVNVVLFDGEHKQIKEYLDEVTGGKNFGVIIIRDDMSHVYEIAAALANNELVCMHADRFLDGNKTMSLNFLGKPALFPAGPFSMAAGFNVPVCTVFAFKETLTHYHFYGSPLILRQDDEQKNDFTHKLARLYVAAVEEKVNRYPEQWFNYYDFWSK